VIASVAMTTKVHVGGEGSEQRTHERYKIFRAYVEHEDVLVNNRLLWNINIQGFLFATYGFSVQKLAEVVSGHEWKVSGIVPLCSLIVMLPIVGFLVSCFSLIGVVAAQDAIRALKEQWEGLVGEEYSPKDLTLLPNLIGGGKGASYMKHHEWGFHAPKMIPVICLTVWALLFLSFFATLFYYHFFRVGG
jgi:hypothetical protein